jgi:hypothetical protein
MLAVGVIEDVSHLTREQRAARQAAILAKQDEPARTTLSERYGSRHVRRSDKH